MFQLAPVMISTH